jgi:predicted aldo/keto reductase-like oxidoreductase
MLEKRALGKTGLFAAPLGVACNFGVGPDVIERAVIEHGTNYLFVTTRAQAGIEGVRRLVKGGRRDDIVIAAGANVPFGWSVRREWEKCARLFGVDVIDVFHLFWVQAHWYVTGNTWREMRKLKEEGKVRALAISCHDRPMAAKLAAQLDLDLLMIRYNAAHRGAESEIFPHVRIPIVAYTATRWGRLLRPAGDLGPMTAPECYRFALSHPSVSVVLCGPKNQAELEEDVAGAAQGPLGQERLQEVRRFGDAVRASLSGRIGFA